MGLSAPAPAPISFPNSENMGDNYARAYTQLRQIREEVVSIRESLKSIEDTTVITDTVARQRELEKRYTYSLDKFRKDGPQIDSHIDTLKRLSEQVPIIGEKIGDIITRIENEWNTICSFLSPQNTQSNQITPDTVVSWAKESKKPIDKIILNCCYVTIPPRLNDHLKSIRVGQSFDFHTNFKDELPEEDQRKEILKYLAAHPVIVQGIVEIETGFILKAASNWRRRYFSVLMIIAAIFLGIGVVYIFSNIGAWLSLSNWPGTPSRFLEFLGLYIFIVIGALAHIVISVVKQSRDSDSHSMRVLEDWVVWVHVKETSNFWAVISLWIAFFALVYFDPKADWATAFFVGYSIDSIIDTVLQRFTDTASSETERVKQVLGGV